MSSNKNPPLLSKSTLYIDWKKKVDIWASFTTLEAKKHAAAVLLTLEGSAEEAVLELDLDVINSETGLQKLIDKLDTLYLKDKTLEKFQALEKFDIYHRDSQTSMQEHIHQFDKLYHKLKSHGTDISEDLLAYKLLKSANLSKQDEKLAKGTVNDLTLLNMKAQLKKIFPDKDSLSTKPTDSLSINEINEATAIDFENEANNTFYAGRQYNQQNRRYIPPRRPILYGNPTSDRRHSNNQHPDRRYPSQPPSSGRNPTNSRTGETTRCNICESIYHWASDCPEKSNHGSNQRSVRNRVTSQPRFTFYENFESQHEDDEDFNQYQIPDTSCQKIVLFQSDYDHPSNLTGLVAESWNAAVLDCGANKTVCGRNWYNTFIDSLGEQNDVQVLSPSGNVYKFGDTPCVVTSQTSIIPAVLGPKKVGISIDVIEKDIPLLLSRRAMKKAQMSINFRNDTAVVFNATVHLQVTKSGHYIIPLTPPTQLLATFNAQPKTNIVLAVQHTTSKHNQALKLHRQFAHAPVHKLIKLIKSAGEPWSCDKELEQELHSISKSCKTCQQYGRAASRPIVGLPQASSFLETVAMDLKFYNKKILLHMIDHATRLSVCVRVPSKQPKDIIKCIFSNWISVFGTTEKFLTDNGGEFVNNDFIEMCETLNINIKTTGAESPWSNGLVERHNQTISEMLDKVLDDTNCDFIIALAWCVNVKNSLNNCHGFSPYQLAIGRNPKLPAVLHDALPALSSTDSSSDILRQNLNALHSAREAFMQSEHSEKIRRALNNNTRTYSDAVILNGDVVFYKRNNQTKWKGPATVLGKDGQQVLLKHGGFYIRVHPCRIRLARDSLTAKETNSEEKVPTTHSSIPKSTTSQNNTTDVDSDSDDEVAPELRQPNQPQVVPTPPPTPSTNTPRRLRTNQRKHPMPQIDEPISTPEQNNLQVPDSLSATDESDTDNQKAANNNLSTIRLHTKVKFCLNNEETWEEGTIHSRAGKAGGKHKHAWNVVHKDGKVSPVDFSKDVSAWYCYNSENQTDSEVIPSETFIAQVDDDIEEAKQRELQSWQSREVYDEVVNQGQPCMSVRWVITPKVINGVPSTKARLCAKGFQEVKDFRKDSPTCSRESIRLVLAVTATMRWKLQSIDIQAAFLQGAKMDRSVFLTPPQEAKTDKIWLLKKCVYGLADAPRQFYLRLRQELVKLHMSQNLSDNGLFYWYSNDQLSGILVSHVDDVLFSGTAEFITNVIEPLGQVLKFGTEHDTAFKYLGIDLKQHKDYSITLNQNNFAKSLTKIKLPEQIERTAPVNAEITADLRSRIGQLNWLACVSRPEISFDVSSLSSKIKLATLAEVIEVNKVITKIQNNPSHLTFPPLDKNSLYIKAYADGSFNSLPNAGSQGGQVILLCDKDHRCCILGWNSTRLKRVARSALAAESLALCDGCDLAINISATIDAVLLREVKIPVYAVTDSRSLYETLGSTKQPSDKNLKLEVYAMREMVNKGDIRIVWVEGSKQISDTLTKRGASWKLLHQVMLNGQLPHQ